jgi:hypothetical protein
VFLLTWLADKRLGKCAGVFRVPSPTPNLLFLKI